MAVDLLFKLETETIHKASSTSGGAKKKAPERIENRGYKSSTNISWLLMDAMKDIL